MMKGPFNCFLLCIYFFLFEQHKFRNEREGVGGKEEEGTGLILCILGQDVWTNTQTVDPVLQKVL